MDTKNKCSAVDEGSEKEGSNCCCCAFLKRQSKQNADDHGKFENGLNIYNCAQMPRHMSVGKTAAI